MSAISKYGSAVHSLIGAALCLASSAFFAWAFYERYWKWRECIAVVESSCTEPGAGNATEGGMFWGLFAAIFLGLTLVFGVRAMVRLRRGTAVDPP